MRLILSYSCGFLCASCSVSVPGNSIAWSAGELKATIGDLVNKNNLDMIKARLIDTSVQLKELKAQIQDAETRTYDAVVGSNLQIEATKALASLDSYLTQGMLLVLLGLGSQITQELYRAHS